MYEVPSSMGQVRTGYAMLRQIPHSLRPPGAFRSAHRQRVEGAAAQGRARWGNFVTVKVRNDLEKEIENQMVPILPRRLRWVGFMLAVVTMVIVDDLAGLMIVARKRVTSCDSECVTRLSSTPISFLPPNYSPD